MKKYYCKNCNKKISYHSVKYGTGRCRTCAGKIHSKRMKGKKNPNFGNPLNMKGKNHPRFKNGKFLKKNFCIDCKSIIHPNAKRCQSCKQLGKLNHKYIDGRSFFPYPLEFNDKLKLKIRKRDNFTCQKCSKLEIDNNRKLDIHHIDYDKENCKEENLITPMQ